MKLIMKILKIALVVCLCVCIVVAVKEEEWTEAIFWLFMFDLFMQIYNTNNKLKDKGDE